MYMLPPDVKIGEAFSIKFFDEKYYSPRTLKAFIFAFGWLEANRDILPKASMRFHGKYFSFENENNEHILYVNFQGCKLGWVEVFDKDACSKLISVCKPIDKFSFAYEWVGR